MLQPTIPETHTRRWVARQLRTRTLVRRMLKQGHACFLPQTLTKQERGIDSNRQHRRRDRLREVVMIRKVPGVALEMDLETRVARFHHDVFVRELQLVQPLDVNRKRAATHSNHASIQLVITRDRSEIVE